MLPIKQLCLQFCLIPTPGFVYFLYNQIITMKTSYFSDLQIENLYLILVF